MVDKKTVGAWIVHHAQKLQLVRLVTPDYEQVAFAGKCGIMLSALAGSESINFTTAQIEALATANGISTRLELPTILEELNRQRLIDRATNGILVLGLTPTQTLEYTTGIFLEASPSICERTSIVIADKASDLPLIKTDTAEYVSDTYKLSASETAEILNQQEQIGFYDSEEVADERLYFNGNLFRRENAHKASAILRTIKPEEERLVVELTEMLKTRGCIARSEAIRLLGEQLFEKMCAIGFIDVSSVGNESGIFSFVTRPAAFSKFTHSVADDAFDLAKAFVTSLTYGMTASPSDRGHIRMIEALMRKLIDGEWVGPATAIGQDYRILETKGVVSVRPTGDGRFFMKLRKKEVGILALSVMTEGEVCGTNLPQMPNVSATQYTGPEYNRTIVRRKQTDAQKRDVAGILDVLRTGGPR